MLRTPIMRMLVTHIPVTHTLTAYIHAVDVCATLKFYSYNIQYMIYIILYYFFFQRVNETARRNLNRWKKAEVGRPQQCTHTFIVCPSDVCTGMWTLTSAHSTGMHSTGVHSTGVHNIGVRSTALSTTRTPNRRTDHRHMSHRCIDRPYRYF